MFGGEVSDAEEENFVTMKVRYGWMRCRYP